MPEYRITIKSRRGDPEHSSKRPGNLEVLKAVLLGILGLAILIGIVIAAFVVGSIIASVLLILLAVVIVMWAIRRLVRKVKSSY
jgi:membrane protein YdbS with pleckstrin-like domain